MLGRWFGASTIALVLLGVAPACRESGRPPSGVSTAPDATPTVDAGAAVVRYLALGDSFTIGTGSAPARAFPARLGERWQARGCALVVENVAVNGYTTDDLIAQELPALATFRPTFVTIAIGANDIVRGASIDAYRINVRRILDAATATGAKVVVLPQPDWSRSPTAASFGTRATLAESITRFNAVLAEEARVRKATWVDLTPLMQQQAERGELASDGLHPAASAYDAWAVELARSLPCGG